MEKKLIVAGCIVLVWIMTSFLFELGMYRNDNGEQLLGLAYGCLGIVYVAMIIVLGYVFIFVPEKDLQFVKEIREKQNGINR